MLILTMDKRMIIISCCPIQNSFSVWFTTVSALLTIESYTKILVCVQRKYVINSSLKTVRDVVMYTNALYNSTIVIRIRRNDRQFLVDTNRKGQHKTQNKTICMGQEWNGYWFSSLIPTQFRNKATCVNCLGLYILTTTSYYN